MTDIVVRNALLVDEPNPRVADVSIDGGQISALSPAGQGPEASIVLDAAGAPTFPGLVNGHLHSNEFLMKGRVFGQPLEPYILSTWARVPPSALPSPDVVYSSTVLNCADMLRGGVTSAIDDFTPLLFEDDYLDATMTAYRDMGMRADVSVAIMDLPLEAHIPGVRTQLAGTSGAAIKPDAVRNLEFMQRQLRRWPADGRVRCIVSPSAPQRTSSELLGRLHDLSRQYEVPLHIHVQESRIQAVSGPALFGSSMVQYLVKIGVLDERTTIAHGIWLDDADIDVVADSGASVIHNPASNLKLGSGVASVWRMRQAGINVGLGTDANTCNDSQDVLEGMKLAALLSCIGSADPAEWLSPSDVLAMATVGGARASGWEGVGRIAVGAAADLVITRSDALAFTPLNEPLNQLVYAASRADVRTVIANGRVLVEDGQLKRKLDAHRAVVQEAAESFWAHAAPSLVENDRFRPAFGRAYAIARSTVPGAAAARETLGQAGPAALDAVSW